LKEHVWNKAKMKKNPLPTLATQNVKEKNPGTFNACFSLPIGHMYFWFSKLLVTIFGLG
jgi:hypothetical protein